MEIIKCPECKGYLRTLEVYGNPKFMEETFQCEKCNKYFRRRIDYEPETRKIINDKIVEIKK